MLASARHMGRQLQRLHPSGRDLTLAERWHDHFGRMRCVSSHATSQAHLIQAEKESARK